VTGSFLHPAGPVPSRPERMLTPQQVANRLQVEVTTARRLARAGAFPGAYRSGLGRRSHWRIPPRDVDQFVARTRPVAAEMPVLPVLPELPELPSSVEARMTKGPGGGA
jgi:excisionase family DNA binding protein